MYVKVVCYPPLGEPTVLPIGTGWVKFTVVLETDAASEKPWEVALWCDLDLPNCGKWTELALEEETNPKSLMSIGTTLRERTRKRVFGREIYVNEKRTITPIHFTIKFRQDRSSAWKWAYDQSGLPDGELIFQLEQPTTLSDRLEDYIHGLNPSFRITQVTSDTPNTKLWLLEASTPAASGDDSGFCTRTLGQPIEVKRWFALCRLWAAWIVPTHGKDIFQVDKDTVLCSFLRSDGLHLVILGFSGAKSDLTLFHSNNGNVIVKSRNDQEKEGRSQVLVAVAPSFEFANAAVMYLARKMVMELSQMKPMHKNKELFARRDPVSGMELRIQEKDIAPTWYEEWVDGFTYCTWNGLGQGLNESKIFEALDALESHGIKITNLIIDDNWQSLDNAGQDQSNRGMTEFEANKEGFPKGLRSTASEIRRKNPSIKHIAVWHTMLGYWGAISPTGKLAKDYKTVQAKKPGGGYWTCIDPDDVDRFYNNFYIFLSSCGIDSVKTDAQFMLDDLQSARDRRHMITAYQDAWTIAHLRYFGARAISCMSQAPPIIFHEQMRTSNPQILVRNSDDFFPDIESSHPWHVFCNAHNALLTQHLNALPDWDMFQTSHPWAWFHGAARCVSGGPVYITDTPGKHNTDLIKEMTAETINGKTVILRPHRIAKSSNAYRGYNEHKLLHINTFCGDAEKGISILGVFNVSQQLLTEIITLKDFPGTENGTYVVRSHISGSICEPCTQGHSNTVCMDLSVKGYDILSAYPVRQFTLKHGDVHIANLGLLGKMTGAAAIVNTDFRVENQGRIRIWTALKALGILGIYISELSNRSIEDDFLGLLFGKGIGLHCVRKSPSDKNILEIDLKRAWEESDKKAGWSNEVNFELFIR